MRYHRVYRMRHEGLHVAKTLFFDPSALSNLTMLYLLTEHMRDGILVFRADERLVLANAVMRALLPCEQDGDGAVWLKVDRFFPAGALAQATQQGYWTGSLLLDERVAITHLYAWSGDAHGYYLGVFHHFDDNQDYEDELQKRHAELRRAYMRLNGAEDKLLQSEKMASIGQLAAGVAHEINNPIGYVHSNLGTLQEYLRSLFTLIDLYERALVSPEPKAFAAEIAEIRQREDFDFIARDLPQLMAESREGIERVTRIVRDLKDFSYSDRSDAWKKVDLHAGLESTINIIWNELKYKVTLERRYGNLPLVECLPSELNQVYMNLLLNAGQAIAERGTITVSSGCDSDAQVWISIQDTGVGITPEHLQRIFDPFFTTKPVGRGTGLGLAISYRIIDKHHGRIDVQSQPGQGSIFRIVLPVEQSHTTPS